MRNLSPELHKHTWALLTVSEMTMIPGTFVHRFECNTCGRTRVQVNGKTQKDGKNG